MVACGCFHMLIPRYFCHSSASECPPPRFKWGHSWGHFGVPNLRFSWGLALETLCPSNIFQLMADLALAGLIVPIPRYFYHSSASECPPPRFKCGNSWGHFGFPNLRLSWGLALETPFPSNISQLMADLTRAGLIVPIPRSFCHSSASECSPPRFNWVQSCGHFGLQNLSFNWGLAFQSPFPSNISQLVVVLAPAGLIVPIPSYLCHSSASKCSPPRFT